MPILRRAPSLLLKSTPPRAVRSFLERERLQLRRLEAGGAQIAVLLAPTGFGKTSQLNHWRREALACGGLAMWLSIDNNDEPLRLVRGLAFSAQLACGKRGFDDTFMNWLEDCHDPQQALTAWLAEIADLSVDVTLLLDDAERMPGTSLDQLLPQLIDQAPANLHIAIAARPSSAMASSSALRMARTSRLGSAELRFRMNETLAVLSSALGSRCNLEAAAALHDLTEGWPFGVQLAAAALYRSGDLEGLVSAATADIRHYFVDTVINSQSPDAVQLLVRLANFDLIHPELCSSVLDHPELSRTLQQLHDETPLLSRTEEHEWMRLHPLARDVLRERLLQIPPVERQTVARKASIWYASRELYEEAAQQSLLAGDINDAFDLVERTSYQMTVQGKGAAVLAWYNRLSEQELRQHPGFWAPAAWALAMSEHNRQTRTLLDLLLTKPDVTPAERFEAALIQGAVAGFCDRIDESNERMAAWPTPPVDAHPQSLPIYFFAQAFQHLYLGQPEHARRALAQTRALDPETAYSPVSFGLSDYGLGLSYIFEGRYALAEQELRPALARAEERIGRHGAVTCMLAALLAQACWEGSCSDDPSAILAGRLITLERHGLPESLIVAYRTLARAADRDGRQDQALNLLESLNAIGQSRDVVRLQASAKYELLHLHLRHGRIESAAALSSELDRLLHDRQASICASLTPWVKLQADIGRLQVMLARQDNSVLPAASEIAETALAMALHLKLSREEVEVRLLRAEILQRQGRAEARTMRLEAVSLAQANGMQRLLREEQAEREPLVRAIVEQEKPSPAPEDAYLRGTALLTTKEREVLSLLSRSMSNKEIARAMVVSEETIKWHVKNLFSKFNASGRKHVVARARMLGLVD